MGAKSAAQSSRERRVTKVLDAAQELFAARGYEATLVAEIAQSASVAPATIYNYFSTKPNLLMELALRHVRAALPERRAFLNLSRECWRTMMAAQMVEPRGRAARTGARLNDLIRRQYVQIIRTYQARGRLVADVDAGALSDLIVGVATMNFARFVYEPSGTIEDLLRIGLPHIALILRGLLLDKRSGPRRRTRME
jgi:AcrR family transcriptional regulator